MASFECNPPPLLDKNHYLFKNVLCCEPVSAWKYCVQLQKKWNEEYSSDQELMKCMKRWKESKSLHLIWVSDKFSGTLPSAVSEKKTYVLLTKSYTDLCSEFEGDSLRSIIDRVCEPKDEQVPQAMFADRNAERDRVSELQLKQHLKALMFLTRAAENKISLSENLIKWGHRFLMEGLHTEDRVQINAGGYRTCPVSDGDHVYIHHLTIPDVMTQLVSKYNGMQGHDPFARASWLLTEFLTIHPFEDGNVRMSRLLWCYSLMSDGLPFPLTPFPGVKRAYKKYVECVKKDRDRLSKLYEPSTTCINTTSLTVVSITNIWENFISNLRQESPDKHKEIAKWLDDNKITLNPVSTSATK